MDVVDILLGVVILGLLLRDWFRVKEPNQIDGLPAFFPSGNGQLFVPQSISKDSRHFYFRGYITASGAYLQIDDVSFCVPLYVSGLRLLTHLPQGPVLLDVSDHNKAAVQAYLANTTHPVCRILSRS